LPGPLTMGILRLSERQLLMVMVLQRRQLVRNIFSSWTGYGLRILIALFFIPYITSVLGDDRYGVWVIVFQTINYLSLLDFGLERALVRYLSRFLGQNDFLNVNRVLNTSWAIYLALGTIIIVAAYFTATFLFQYFRIENAMLLQEGRTALIVVGVYLGVRFYLLPFGGSLSGLQRHDITEVLQMAEEVIRVVVLVWLLANGYGLAALALAILAVSVLRQAATVLCLRRLFPRITANLRLASRETASTLISYSRISFGITVAWLVIFNTDSVLLGLLSSAAAAGVYAPGAQMMLYFRNAVNSIGSPLTSAVSHWEANRDIDTVRRVYLKGVKYTSYLSFFIAAGVIVWAGPFVRLWLQPEFAGAAEVMTILSVSTAVFIPQILGNAILFGLGQHRYLLYVLILEASTKVILSLFLIGPYGITGMALAAAIPQLLLYTTLYPWLIGRALELSPGRILRTSLLSGLRAAVVAVPAALLARAWLVPHDWLNFFGGTVAVTLITLSAGLFVLEPSDRSRLRTLLTSKTNRKT